ncbi:putative transcription factor C2H2 family [Helianthus annuus]|nr:putative transcription factor C2H2 family [Helianthus annuus]
MGRILSENRQEKGLWVELPVPSEITISPILLWVIVSMAAIFFISGIIHVLFKIYKQGHAYPSISQSIRYTEFSHPQSFGRQLQQLFRLQDSGLDPSFIEKLPVFEYKHIMGTKYPFDCAVCLCEFAPHDMLRLIPVCSHAFHTHCIDTWLLSNSTCPLCRVNLSSESALTDRHAPLENCVNVSTNSIERVFSVRLGKLKSLKENEKSIGGEISRCNLDARRCFSMGSFRYVVEKVDMQVTLLDVKDNNVDCGKGEDNMDLRKLKHESLSISKVWLWSKKGKFPMSSSEIKVGDVSSSQNIILSSN